MFGCFSLSPYSFGSLMKRKTSRAAAMVRPEPIQNGKLILISYSVLPTREAMIVPTPPIRLMMPLACERNCDGVMSGMSATTGVRQKAMLSKSVLVQATNSGSTDASGISPKTSAPMGAPIRMNGIRRPIGVRRRSDHAPTGGWMKSAAILSRVMKKPIKIGERPKRLARKSGTNALYTVQMTLTPKKPKPSRKILP